MGLSPEALREFEKINRPKTAARGRYGHSGTARHLLRRIDVTPQTPDAVTSSRVGTVFDTDHVRGRPRSRSDVAVRSPPGRPYPSLDFAGLLPDSGIS